MVTASAANADRFQDTVHARSCQRRELTQKHEEKSNPFKTTHLAEQESKFRAQVLLLIRTLSSLVTTMDSTSYC